MKAARLTHCLVTQSSCVCSADKVSANTLTVVVPLWPHMQLNMTALIPGCTKWQVKLTPITQARTDAQPCKISHVKYIPLGVCLKFQHFVFCKREPGRLLLWLIIILRGSDPFVVNMISNIKQDPTLTKPKINIFFDINIHIVHITQIIREHFITSACSIRNKPSFVVTQQSYISCTSERSELLPVWHLGCVGSCLQGRQMFCIQENRFVAFVYRHQRVPLSVRMLHL